LSSAETVNVLISKQGDEAIMPELLDRKHSVLVVIDVQERLFPAIYERELMLGRIDLLLTAANLMKIPVILTEQYPKGLGNTIEEIRKLIPDVAPLSKMDFSCLPAPGFKEQLAGLHKEHREQIVLMGIETHICVTQTALDLAAQGERVMVVADATSSRRPIDAQIALQRLSQNGLTITTAESVVFEWLRRAGTDEFKALQSKLKFL
jgi:nicotinamidase-related amidase